MKESMADDAYQIRKATERPIIFVAHSLGGLVLKRVRIQSSSPMRVANDSNYAGFNLLV